MGGASAASQANEAAQTAFLQQMTTEQETQYATQQPLLAQVQQTWAPILAAGPNQEGYSEAENNAQRAEIQNQGTAAQANATDAEALREKQQSGGANVLPSGASDQINADINILGGQKTAQGLEAETAANYAQGRQNFENATTAESGVAGLQNPIGYAGATTNAEGQATNAINLVDTESSSLLDSVLGGVASGASSAAFGA